MAQRTTRARGAAPVSFLNRVGWLALAGSAARRMAALRLRRYGQHLGTIPASASSAILWAADFSTGDTSKT